MRTTHRTMLALVLGAASATAISAVTISAAEPPTRTAMWLGQTAPIAARAALAAITLYWMR